MRPAVLEQRPLRGQRVDHRRRRPRVAVAAEVVGAQRVDRDQQEVEVRRHRFGDGGHPRRWRQRIGGVLAVAVGIDAVARNVGARPDEPADRDRCSRRRPAPGRSRRRRNPAAGGRPPACRSRTPRGHPRSCGGPPAARRAGRRRPPRTRTRRRPARPGPAGRASGRALSRPAQPPPPRSPWRWRSRPRARSGGCRSRPVTPRTTRWRRKRTPPAGAPGAIAPAAAPRRASRSRAATTARARRP